MASRIVAAKQRIRTARRVQFPSLCAAYENCRRRPTPRDGSGLRRHRPVGRPGGAVGVDRADPAVPNGCHDVRGGCFDRHRARGVGWRGLLGWPMRVWPLGVGGLFGRSPAISCSSARCGPPRRRRGSPCWRSVSAPRSISGTTPTSAATYVRWARSPIQRPSCRWRC